MKRALIAVFLAALFCPWAAAEPTVDEIVTQANHMGYYQGKDGSARAEMVVTDAQGRTRTRELTILKLNVQDGGDQKYFVYFHKPNDVRGMTYIVWKHLGKDDDRWLYLPAMDLVRRVAASDKRSSFAGTNFLYEDISGRSVDLDAHELLGSTDKAYQVKNTPKDANAVEFSYYVVEVDKESFLPMKAQYYDKEGRLYRVIEALEVKDVQGHPTIAQMKASDLNSGGSTVTTFTEVKYDIGVTDEIFTERYLRNPPTRWIKG